MAGRFPLLLVWLALVSIAHAKSSLRTRSLERRSPDHYCVNSDCEHGHCFPKSGCKCDSGWYYPYCDKEIDRNHPCWDANTCNGHAVFYPDPNYPNVDGCFPEWSGNGYYCNCDCNWKGNNCEIPVVPCNNKVDCTRLGEHADCYPSLCKSKNPKKTCGCEPGFALVNGVCKDTRCNNTDSTIPMKYDPAMKYAHDINKCVSKDNCLFWKNTFTCYTKYDHHQDYYWKKTNPVEMYCDDYAPLEPCKNLDHCLWAVLDWDTDTKPWHIYFNSVDQKCIRINGHSRERPFSFFEECNGHTASGIFCTLDCAISIDKCKPNPCPTGSTCVNLVESYKCTCPIYQDWDPIGKVCVDVCRDADPWCQEKITKLTCNDAGTQQFCQRSCNLCAFKTATTTAATSSTTTTTATTTATASSTDNPTDVAADMCTDNDPYCAMRAKIGHCGDQLVANACRKSCKLCEEDLSDVEEDLSEVEEDTATD